VLASEIELAALRSQFVATSEEIAKDLSLLAGRIDEEPTELRQLQLAAATEIAVAQERLRLEADRLEGPTERRVAIMQAVLEAQQAAQLQIGVIIKRHRPSTLLQADLDEQLANIARQLEVSAASRLADAPSAIADQHPRNRWSGPQRQVDFCRATVRQRRSALRPFLR